MNSLSSHRLLHAFLTTHLLFCSQVQNAAMAQAVTEFSNNGVNPARPNMQNPGASYTYSNSDLLFTRLSTA